MTIAVSVSGLAARSQLVAARRVVRFAAGSAFAVGGAVLLAWATNMGDVAGIIPGFSQMNPATAICLMLLAAALSPPWRARSSAVRWGRSVIGGLVAMTGAGKVAAVVTGGDFGPDRFVFASRLDGELSFMAPSTGLALVLIGAAFALQLGRSRRTVVAAQLFAFAALCIVFAALIGYVYGAINHYQFPRYGAMSLPTACGLFCIGAGILWLQPGRGITGIVTSKGLGGVLARRALPAVAVIAIGLGAVRTLGLRFHLVDEITGIALLIATGLAALSAFTLVAARVLNRLDAQLADRESALRASEARYRLLTEHSKDLVVMRNAEGRRTYVSPVCRAMLGWEPDELAALPLRTLVHPDDCDSVEGIYAALCPERPDATSAHRLCRKDGTYVWVEASIRLIPDGVQEGAAGIITAVRDISKRKEAEDALRASEERFRLLADGVVDHGFYMLDRHGHVLSWNAGAERIKGYSSVEIVGQSFSCFYTPDDVANGEPLRALGIAAEAGKFEGEGWRVRKDGTRFWAGISLTAMRDSNGALVGFAKITRDLSERDREEERRRVLIEAAPNGMLLVDADGSIAFANSKADQMFAYDPGALAGCSIDRLFPESFRNGQEISRGADAANPDDRAMGTDRSAFGLRRDGSEFPVEISLNVIDARGVRQTVVSVVDVTKRRQVEEALRRSESRYRTLADNSTDMITLRDVEMRLLYVSPACERVLGFSADDLARMPSVDLVYPDDAEAFAAARAGLSEAAPRSAGDYRLRRRDGTHIWVEASLQRIPAGDGEPAQILTVVRDITPRKLAEAEAASAHRLVVDAIEAMSDAVSLYDSDDRLVLANTALLQGGACDPALLVPGRALDDLMRTFWGQRAADMEPAAFENLLAERLEHFRRADGSPFELLGDGGRWLAVRNFRTRDGGTISISTDVTRAKEATAAIEAARDAAEEANKAKSTFLASMSHEIRTPLNGVIGFADLLLDTGLSAEQRRYVSRLKDAGQSLLAIISDILDISKIEAGKLVVENIAMSPAAVAESAAAILGGQIRAKGLALRMEIAPDLPPWVKGDPTRVRQILLNFLSNALKFTEAGQVTIRVRRARDADGRLIRFEVKDTGIGIALDRQHLLFRDFQQIDASTTRQFGGTGLGLSICRRLAEAMGGATGVISAPGEGSSFWFTIALDPCEAPERDEPEVAATSAAVSSRILVAEDVEMNQIIVRAMLKAAGHEVTLVGNGREAVAAVQEKDFDLVLMDMEMPEMDGPTATRAIRGLGERVRGIPVIALTANAMLEDLATCKAAGMNDYVGKPINRDQLLSVVAKWSGKAGAGHAAASPPDLAVLDEKTLATLESTLGVEQVAQLCVEFRGRIDEAAAVLAGVGAGGADQAREAHNLISLAGTFGCLELMQLAQQLHGAIRAGESGVEARAADVAAAATRAVAALRSRYPA